MTKKLKASRGRWNGLGTSREEVGGRVKEGNWGDRWEEEGGETFSMQKKTCIPLSFLPWAEKKKPPPTYYRKPKNAGGKGGTMKEGHLFCCWGRGRLPATPGKARSSNAIGGRKKKLGGPRAKSSLECGERKEGGGDLKEPRSCLRGKIILLEEQKDWRERRGKGKSAGPCVGRKGQSGVCKKRDSGVGEKRLRLFGSAWEEKGTAGDRARKKELDVLRKTERFLEKTD